ncbi:MAG: aminoacyl-tRNA hydrolase [Phycisphaerae bacterium]|nr:aminoacyl-tRNA hydrolase [Phycisphaerae bacterium]
MKLVVGLGNPGPRYAQTRHNVGFMVIDQILRLCPGPKQQEKFAGLFNRIFIDEQPLALLKPTTSMNLSGIAVAQAMSFYKLPLENLLVITDDMALPPGKLRLRRCGSPGGHNGLASISSHLASENFSRLRVGIGPPNLPDPADYVLAEFSDQQWPSIAAVLDRAAQAVRCWACDGIDVVMNRFNAPEEL